MNLSKIWSDCQDRIESIKKNINSIIKDEHHLINDNEVPGVISGLDRLNKKRFNKGLGFTMEERQLLGIHGLLPPAVKSVEQQLDHCMIFLNRLCHNLDKYLYLVQLSERNERLFFKLLTKHFKQLYPIIYLPTIHLICRRYSLLYTHSKGLFITIHDKGYIGNVLKNWPETDVRLIVVTDGENVLGTGDSGANGMAISCSKLYLYTVLAGIKPYQCLPIALDVGTNSDILLKDPHYIGLRQNRVSCESYFEFIDEFMQAVANRFRRTCLIQFEDFGPSNAISILRKYRYSCCMFNDDIQVPASVAFSGILSAIRLSGIELYDNKFLFFGSGESAMRIANLCLMALHYCGLTNSQAKTRVWLMDKHGLLCNNRPNGNMNDYKKFFAHNHEPIDTLYDAVKIIKPTVLIGTSNIPNSFTSQILGLMTEYNEKPIIFALSSPCTHVECTAEEAFKSTQGKCIFSSSIPFEPVTIDQNTYHCSHGNNVYIFPGIALGVLCSEMLTVPEELFLIAAKTLSEEITENELNSSLYPPLCRVQEITLIIAEKIMSYAYCKCWATLRPEPVDKIAYIKSQMYDLNYPSVIPKFNRA